MTHPNQVSEVERHELYATPTVVALRNALERINPNHSDICLMVGLLETWFDQCTSADLSEQLDLVSDLWASMRGVYATSPEEVGEFVREGMSS